MKLKLLLGIMLLQSVFLKLTFAQEKPNILFIAVDDLKPNIACYGDSLAITPNIDALAASGMLFSRAYCQQAVCAPSRASLMTSRYPDQTGVHDLQTMMRDVSPDITSLPEYLITQGYLTTATGKIFDFRSVDDEMDAPSWSLPYRKHYDSKYYDPVNGRPSNYYASPFSKDTIAALRAEAILLGLDEYSHIVANYQPSVERADVAYDGYVDGAILNVGIELLNEVAAQDKPFFLGVGFHRPHLPFVAPGNFWDLYDRSDFSLAPFQKKASNSPDLAYHNYEELRNYTDIPNEGDMSEEQQLELIHGYYAATSYIDHLLGMLLTRLDELGLRENTIIVLWGDHGWHLGDHNLWCKHSNFEEATNVPLIFTYPGQPNKGKICEAPVEFTDIATTLCELTNSAVPEYFEGESLKPLFEDPDTSIRKAALSQYPKWGGIMGYSLRSERYRYTKWLNEDGSMHSRELYDYFTDPRETFSRASDPDLLDLVTEMDSMLMRRVSVPSTQERIAFRLYGRQENGDSILIPDASINLQGSLRATNEDGEVLFTNVPGSYTYAINARGFINTSGQIELSKDTLLSLTLEQEFYDITLQIIAGWNLQPVVNAAVELLSETGISDAMGNVTFQDIAYDSYDIFVTFFGDLEQTFPGIEIYSDTSIILNLQQVTYNIDVSVVDLLSKSSVQVCDVSLNGVTKQTGVNGTLSFSEIEGRYEIRIQKEYYATLVDSIYVKENTSVLYELDPSHSSVKIWVKDGGNPINNALVRFGDHEFTSGSLGLARFENLPNRENYSCTVLRNGYGEFNKDFYLLADTVITISLTKTGNINAHAIHSGMKLYPNPVSESLFVEFVGSESLCTIEIVGLDACVHYLGSCSSQRTCIDLANLNSGFYFVKGTTTEGEYWSTFIKR